MHRRELLLTTSAAGVLLTSAGCLDGGGTADPANTTADDDPAPTPSNNTSEDEQNTTEQDGECQTETNVETETVLDSSSDIAGGDHWTRDYQVEAGDSVTFDVSASADQELDVEIESPEGRTVYSESGQSLTTSHEFDTGGDGEVRITNRGTQTEAEREVLWNNRVEVAAGEQLSLWAALEDGDRIDYYIRKLDGARPLLRIEDEYGGVMREHAVAAVIDDTISVSSDGRYYFHLENTASLTAGTWDYAFERVSEVPIPTTATLTIEREFETELEVCD